MLAFENIAFPVGAIAVFTSAALWQPWAGDGTANFRAADLQEHQFKAPTWQCVSSNLPSAALSPPLLCNFFPANKLWCLFVFPGLISAYVPRRKEPALSARPSVYKQWEPHSVEKCEPIWRDNCQGFAHSFLQDNLDGKAGTRSCTSFLGMLA